MGKEEKKLKMAKEAATAEFEAIVDAFGFNVSMETTKRIVSMDINNIPMSIQQEIVDSAAVVEKIMKGVISFDEEKTEIVYKLKNEIKTGENGAVRTKEFRFGVFTRSSQLSCGVELNKCNFSTLPDQDQTKLLMALTGVSDEGIFGELSIPQYQDLKMVGAYFFQ